MSTCIACGARNLLREWQELPTRVRRIEGRIYPHFAPVQKLVDAPHDVPHLLKPDPFRRVLEQRLLRRLVLRVPESLPALVMLVEIHHNTLSGDEGFRIVTHFC